jgi:hypothetical protein
LVKPAETATKTPGFWQALEGRAHANAADMKKATILSYGGISSKNSHQAGLTINGHVALTIRWTKRKCQ